MFLLSTPPTIPLINSKTSKINLTKDLESLGHSKASKTAERKRLTVPPEASSSTPDQYLPLLQELADLQDRTYFRWLCEFWDLWRELVRSIRGR